MRLWSAQASRREINLGHSMRVTTSRQWKIITTPRTKSPRTVSGSLPPTPGRELRLRQGYFPFSSTIQDILKPLSVA
ncbi:hypothetical protein ACLK19_22955 [Escherichia coli]